MAVTSDVPGATCARARNVGSAAVLRWLLPLALLHGLIFMLFVPPWQHYDETAHFLYAAEIAAGEREVPGPASAAISREIADSMYRFRFFTPEVRPDLFSPQAPLVGISQRVHPPLYYALLALPLRAVSALGIEQQLYLGRAVSLCFYVLTVVTAWRIALALMPEEPLLQLALPLLVLLAPAFTDIMTAVNNDVLLNFSVTVALLGAVLLVRDGPRPVPLALTLLGILVAILVKRVAVVACIPLSLALVWSVWREQVRWWALMLIAAAGFALFSLVLLEPTVVEGPSGPHTIFAARPWFAALAETYLRVNVDALLRSFTDSDLIGRRYESLLIVGFGGFWGHFGWGKPALHPAWIWLMAGLSAIATIGLLAGPLGVRADLPLWQRRCRWLFLVAVIVAWFSLFVRLHPLPPLETPVYIPRGRYMFWAIVPNVSLLALGLVSAVPPRWRQAVPYALIGLFVCLSTVAWLGTIVNYYYR